jgi:DNA-3-methyladenine glycosylase
MKGAHQPGRKTRISHSFYRRDAVSVARGLLGQRFVTCIDNRRTSGIIVETEAYLGAADKAAHTYGDRRTARNETMWGDGGHLYVYFVYGMHHCANVVAGVAGDPAAVLLRALEPEEGLDVMFERRATASRPVDLCSGPGKLCQALGITRTLDGADLAESDAIGIESLRQRAMNANQIASGPRIGVGYAQEWRDEPLRFWVRGNPHVSRSA